jgi:hypothetical protein
MFWLSVRAAVHTLVTNAPRTVVTAVCWEQQRGRLVLQGPGAEEGWDFAHIEDVRTGRRLGSLGARDPEWDEPATQAYSARLLAPSPPQEHVALVASTTEYERVRETLDDLEGSGEACLDRVWGIVTSRSTVLPRVDLDIPLRPFAAKLNREQASAVRMALSNAPVTLIEGPPGTGKSTVLVEAIRQAVLAGKRVLCVSPTHQAVDNVIDRLRKEALPFVPIRVGHEDRVGHGDLTPINRLDTIAKDLVEKRLPGLRLSATAHSMREDALLARLATADDLEALLAIGERGQTTEADTIAKLRERFFPEVSSDARLAMLLTRVRTEADFLREKLRLARAFANLDAASVQQLAKALDQRGSAPVFGTAVGFLAARDLSRRRDDGKPPFDLLIIDEASKLTLPQFLLGALRSTKVVLVGDSRQLPPFVNTVEQAALLAHGLPEGLMTRSTFSHLEASLLPCYRQRLVRQYRMHRDLAHFPSYKFYEGRLRTGRGDGTPYLATRHRLVWLDVQGREERQGRSWLNHEEAAAIVRTLRDMEAQLAQEPTPRPIGILTFYKAQRSLLASLVAAIEWRHLEVEVGTVDSFQGKEKDLILLSFVRTRHMGFVNNKERLNVALTRARDYLFFVGDARFHRAPDHLLADLFHHPAMTCLRRY